MAEDEQAAEQSKPLDLTALEIEQILGLFIGILAAKAWQYMGLQLTPGEKETKKDMAKASAAIDSASCLTDRLVPYLSDAEAQSIRAVITDLKINYAKNA